MVDFIDEEDTEAPKKTKKKKAQPKEDLGIRKSLIKW